MKNSQNPCSKIEKQPVISTYNPQTLEEMLVKAIMNPTKFNSEVRRLVAGSHPQGVTHETREGLRVHPGGEIERVKEEVNYVQTLSDGTAVEENGFVRCQTCKKVVRVESIERCPCGQTCCISKKCGCYSKSKDQWYCSKSHALLEKFWINLRWVS